MTYKFTKKGIERPFVPERDLIRIIKYGTCDLLELDDMLPEGLDPGELTYEEIELIDWWYLDIADEEE